MDQQKKMQTSRREDHFSADGGPVQESDGGLLEQVQKWGDVARAAYEGCQHGADAEQELRRRRNRSGQ